MITMTDHNLIDFAAGCRPPKLKSQKSSSSSRKRKLRKPPLSRSNHPPVNQHFFTRTVNMNKMLNFNVEDMTQRLHERNTENVLLMFSFFLFFLLRKRKQFVKYCHHSVPHSEVERQNNDGTPHLEVERQNNHGAPQSEVERQNQHGAPHSEVERQTKYGAPDSKVERQTKHGAPDSEVERQTKHGAPHSEVERQLNHNDCCIICDTNQFGEKICGLKGGMEPTVDVIENVNQDDGDHRRLTSDDTNSQTPKIHTDSTIELRRKIRIMITIQIQT